MNNICRWCGNEAYEIHHLFRRSTAPEQKDNPDNLIELCRRCHRNATENREFEHLLQEKFFSRPDIELTIENIQEALRSNIPLSPREIVDFRKYLAGEFSFLGARMEEILRQKPAIWMKLRENTKSDARAEKEWEMTMAGQEEKILKSKTKRIEKMLSALRSMLELLLSESRNQF